MKGMKIVFAMVAVSSLLVSCGQSMSGSVYSRDQARQVQKVYEGEVIMVRQVQIEGEASGLGTLAAGYLGYRVGGTIGGGSGRKVAEAAGAAAGAAAGSAVTKAATKQAGLEITVKLDNGDVVSVVQAADEAFDEGDQVRVLMRPDGSARVIQ